MGATNVSRHSKYQTVSMEPTFNLSRILNDLALERIAFEEAEEAAYLRVWEVPGKSDSSPS